MSIEHICESGIALELVFNRLTADSKKRLLDYMLKIYGSLDNKRISEYVTFFSKVDRTYTGSGTPLYSRLPKGCCTKCFKPRLGAFEYTRPGFYENRYNNLVLMNEIREENHSKRNHANHDRKVA